MDFRAGHDLLQLSLQVAGQVIPVIDDLYQDRCPGLYQVVQTGEDGLQIAPNAFKRQEAGDGQSGHCGSHTLEGDDLDALGLSGLAEAHRQRGT